MTNVLPEFIQEKVYKMPEYSYGVNKVTAYLKNGDIIRDVHIAHGEKILCVGDNFSIPFYASDIANIGSPYNSNEIPYILPEFLKEKVRMMSKCYSETNKVTAFLKNGDVIHNVFIKWGELIVSVGDNFSIPFYASDIADVENEMWCPVRCPQRQITIFELWKEIRILQTSRKCSRHPSDG
jgi:hypothetical protein